MDFTDFTIDKVFSGRQQELDMLSRELLLPEAKIVNITGPTGSGKSALARTFAHQHREAFPAGIYHIYVSRRESLQDTIANHVSYPSSPYLLILDGLDSRPLQQQHSELQALRNLRPSAKIISIGGSISESNKSYVTLELGNLSRAEFKELIEKRAGLYTFDELNDDLFTALGGNALFANIYADLLESSDLTPRELLRRLNAFNYSGLIGVDGRPLTGGGTTEKQIILDIRSASDDLLKKIHGNSKLLYELSPREFEEFVAEVLSRLGYQITLTPASKDGGKDIYAAKKDHLGSFLYIVECKKYSPDNRVGVGLIRQLNGVVQAERATAGILATTSFFTKEAKEFQTQVSHQMGLKDYVGIQEWLDTLFKQ